jgi:hypothetical protein
MLIAQKKTVIRHAIWAYFKGSQNSSFVWLTIFQFFWFHSEYLFSTEFVVMWSKDIHLWN